MGNGTMIFKMRICIVLVLLLVEAKAQSSGKSTSVKDCFEWGVEYHGGGLDKPMVTGVSSPDECQHLCQKRQGCQYFAWVNSQHDVLGYRNTCWLKETSGTHQSCAT